MTFTTSNTLGDLVATKPATARILDWFGLDYCCHGDRSLVDACNAAGIDIKVVEVALAEATTEQDDGPTWTALDLPGLADHIVATHHRYLHEELPLLDALAEKVRSVHGARHAELEEVREIVTELRADLEPHLMKEERVLVPAIRAIVEGRRDFPFGSVENPIRVMTAEHERAGELLERLRRTTRSYVVPDDGCNSYRSLYERLEAVEFDTHLHIHKENHTLFPGAVALFEG